MSRNYGQVCCRTELSGFREDVYAFKHKAMILLPVCTSGLLNVKFYLLDHLVSDISRFGGISRLDVSTFGQFKTTTKTVCRQTP